jgi:hypothetical protein
VHSLHQGVDHVMSFWLHAAVFHGFLNVGVGQDVGCLPFDNDTRRAAMVIDGVMEGSLKSFLRQNASRELQVRKDDDNHEGVLKDFKDLYRVPGLDSGNGLLKCSELSRERSSSNQQPSSFDAELHVLSPRRSPVKGLPDLRLFGRHFMTKIEPRRRCRLCMFSEPKGCAAYDSKISLACKQCNVSLHFECIEEYHKMANPVSQWVGCA